MKQVGQLVGEVQVVADEKLRPVKKIQLGPQIVRVIKRTKNQLTIILVKNLVM